MVMSAKSKLDWVMFLIKQNPFPNGMTGKQWAVLSREIVATIEQGVKPMSKKPKMGKPNIGQLVGGTVAKASYNNTEKGDAVVIIMEDGTQLLICTNDNVHTDMLVAVRGEAINPVRRATKRRTKR